MDQQEEIDQAVISAAAGISIEIDRMIAHLPQGADLGEIASELVWAISDMSDNQAFVEIFSKALAARRALIEMGVNI
jgi:non-canonical (house-cleaning) NTP pyrophosphatase